MSGCVEAKHKLLLHFWNNINNTGIANAHLIHILYPVCGCNLAGVTNDGECSQDPGVGVEAGDCLCKNMTTGRRCDQCVLGYFNLSADNPEGCQGETHSITNLLQVSEIIA